LRSEDGNPMMSKFHPEQLLNKKYPQSASGFLEQVAD